MDPTHDRALVRAHTRAMLYKAHLIISKARQTQARAQARIEESQHLIQRCHVQYALETLYWIDATG